MAGTYGMLCLVLLALAPAVSQATTMKIFPKLRKHVETEAASQESQEEATPVAADTPEEDLPAVPAPIDVGPDGLPELPTTDSMLANASSMLSKVQTQYQVLQDRLKQDHQASQTKMAKQKVVFEGKLRTQEEANLAVVKANTKIKEDIGALNQGNEALRQHSKDVQETSRVMRTELHALQTKLAMAKKFVAESLKATDDAKAKDLTVLQTVASTHKTLHSFLHAAAAEVDDEGSDDTDSNDNDDSSDDSDNSVDGVSLLGLSSRVRRMSEGISDAEVDNTQLAPSSADPTDLLGVLSKDIDHVAEEQQAQLARLKTIFRQNFQAGSKRERALKAHQKALERERTSLQALQTKLHTADEHVVRTQKKLQEELRGLGLFVQRLAHLALAPVAEAPHLLKELPKNVALPSEKAAESKKEA